MEPGLLMAPAWRTTRALAVAEASGKGLWSVQESDQQWLKDSAAASQRH